RHRRESRTVADRRHPSRDSHRPAEPQHRHPHRHRRRVHRTGSHPRRRRNRPPVGTPMKITPRTVPPVTPLAPSATQARFVVPACCPPADHPGSWRALAALGENLAFAILNPDSGPGSAADPRYVEPVAAIRAAGGEVVGYVDTGYGRRSGAAVLRELAAYQSWYGLRGGFLDQVPTGPEHVAHYRRLIAAARQMGIDLIALNPGATPA